VGIAHQIEKMSKQITYAAVRPQEKDQNGSHLEAILRKHVQLLPRTESVFVTVSEINPFK